MRFFFPSIFKDNSKKKKNNYISLIKQIILFDESSKAKNRKNERFAIKSS